MGSGVLYIDQRVRSSRWQAGSFEVRLDHLHTPRNNVNVLGRVCSSAAAIMLVNSKICLVSHDEQQQIMIFRAYL